MRNSDSRCFEEVAGSGAEHIHEPPVPGPDSAETWRRRGEMLLIRKSYAEAVHAFSRAIDLEPHDATVHFYMGIAFTGCGKEPEAVAAYKQALSIKSDYPEVWNNLGGMMEAHGKLVEAAACFERAVEGNGNFVSAINNLGLVCFKLGRLDAAALSFRRVLALKPCSPETLNHLGAVLCLQSAFEDGAACFKQALALRPDYPEAYCLLGNALTRSGKTAEAVDAYERALSLNPDYPEVLCNLGNILKGLGKAEEAMVYLERAVATAPSYAAGINSLGLAHFSFGRFDEASALFRRALKVQPDYPEALNNLGLVLCRQDAYEESIDCCRRALTLRPDYPEVLLNLGNALTECGRQAEAVEIYRRALTLRPDYPEALGNLGAALRLQGALEESIDCCRKTLALRPGSPDERMNLGMVLLAAGRFEEGWREYEWRWQCGDLENVRRCFPGPFWHGEAAEGRVLLLWAEQGFGDSIQFCRYAPLAAARGLRVVLMVQPPLVRLMESLSGVEKVLGSDRALPSCDLHCPLMSLPLAFDTRLETIPNAAPYLFPCEDAVLRWRKRLPEKPPGSLRAGLVWAGNAGRSSPDFAARDRKRSISPEKLAPLLEIPDVQFFSLQKDGPAAPAAFGLVDYMDECRDFADTAALIANLDLVVSVDTAVVHLAGAMGKPVWVLNRFDSCWRWFQDREDNPWYPTLRLFRQPRPGDWTTVIAGVRNELERCVSRMNKPGAGVWECS